MEESGRSGCELAVVIPAYNELTNLNHLLQQLNEHILRTVATVLVIFVDDGSTDGTGAELDRLAAEDGRLRVIHSANEGHGRALMAGVDSIVNSVEWILLMDADNEIDLGCFKNVWRARMNSAAVLGVRRNRISTWDRRITSLGLKVFILVIFGVYLKDANAPFKLLNARSLLQIRGSLAEKPRLSSVDIAVALSSMGFSIATYGVGYRPRQHGSSTLGRMRLAKLAMQSLFELICLRIAILRSQVRS